MRGYSLLVSYSKADKGWIADVLGITYCSAFGKTPEEAVKEVQIALSAMLETYEDKGEDVPRPELDRDGVLKVVEKLAENGS